MARNTFIVAKLVTRESALRSGRGTISVPITLIQVRSNPTIPTEKHAHTITVNMLFRQFRTLNQPWSKGRDKAGEARIIHAPSESVKSGWAWVPMPGVAADLEESTFCQSLVIASELFAGPQGHAGEIGYVVHPPSPYELIS